MREFLSPDDDRTSPLMQELGRIDLIRGLPAYASERITGHDVIVGLSDIGTFIRNSLRSHREVARRKTYSDGNPVGKSVTPERYQTLIDLLLPNITEIIQDCGADMPDKSIIRLYPAKEIAPDARDAAIAWLKGLQEYLAHEEAPNMQLKVSCKKLLRVLENASSLDAFREGTAQLFHRSAEGHDSNNYAAALHKLRGDLERIPARSANRDSHSSILHF